VHTSPLPHTRHLPSPLHHVLGLLIRRDIIVNILQISERIFDKFPGLASICVDKFDVASVIVLNGCCEERFH
jgi:hypothetical protein